MKTTNPFRWTTLTCGIAAAACLPAFAQNTGFYLKADAGGDITLNTNLKEFFGPVAPGTRVKFDPGLRGGIAGGYQVCQWFAPEFEIGFLENQISSITGADRVHDAWFANVPFLVNGKFQYPNSSPLTPYAGAGVGFSEAIIDVGRIDINGTSLHGNISDTVFAWQAFAGLRYQINESMGLSVEYRYFAADGANWRADFTENTASDTMRMGRTQTHAVSLAFDFRF
ncbi:MAG TPA: outer membrane beta-barrel protein [Verrucomicrobiae bacterium]|nr:outer membrane beta-barrel protein [Verrucomicrobiae bacterium]